jgi:AcrR family transcriptional regulator
VRTSKDEIQGKAMDLFLQKGYHGTSTTDICEALNISRPTLYWYFKDKEALLFSLHKESIENRFRVMLTAVKKQEDPLLILRSFMSEYTKLLCGDPSAKVLIKETEYLSQEHIDWVKKNWEEQFEIVRNAILELKQTGRSKDVSETFAAFGLIGMITWAYNWFDTSRPEGIQTLVDTVEEIFLSGLLKPGIQWR